MTQLGARFLAGSRSVTFAGVFSLMVFLLLGRGLYAVALGVISLGVAGQAVAMRGLCLSGSLKVLLTTGMVLFVQGTLAASKAYGISPYPILWCLITVLGIWSLQQQVSGYSGYLQAISFVLVVFVFANLTYNLLWTHWPRYGKFGLFSNIHYMSMYAVMTLPIMFYAISKSLSFRVRCVMALTLMGNVWLLLATRSRPGYLALLSSALVVIPFIAPHFRWRFLLLMAGILAFLYFGNVANFAARVDDFAANFSHDERWEIWAGTFHLQKKSTALQWLFGHGIGAFYQDFKEIAWSRGIKTYLSAHNFFMEILYSHGLSGLVLVTVAYGLFFYRLASAAWDDESIISRRTGMLLLAVATAQLVHGVSTVPFFSRDYLLPLGFVLGASFVYIERLKRTV